MTPEERKEEERKREEWVKTRFNCTMKAVFERLFKVVKQDIETYNSLLRRQAFECVCVDNDCFKVFNIDNRHDGSSKNDVVEARFLLRARFIEISPENKKPFTVSPRWYEDLLECKLLINDNPELTTEFPQISQKTIGHLLFHPPQWPEAIHEGDSP